jgi:hypothetical protein
VDTLQDTLQDTVEVVVVVEHFGALIRTYHLPLHEGPQAVGLALRIISAGAFIFALGADEGNELVIAIPHLADNAAMAIQGLPQRLVGVLLAANGGEHSIKYHVFILHHYLIKLQRFLRLPLPNFAQCFYMSRAIDYAGMR